MLDSEPTGGAEAGNSPAPDTADKTTSTPQDTAGAGRQREREAVAEASAAASRSRRTKAEDTEVTGGPGGEAEKPQIAPRSQPSSAPAVLFMAPPAEPAPSATATDEESPSGRSRRRRRGGAGEAAAEPAEAEATEEDRTDTRAGKVRETGSNRAGTRGRRKAADEGSGGADDSDEAAASDDTDDEDVAETAGGRRRRRRGRRGRGRGKGAADEDAEFDDDPESEPETDEEPADAAEETGTRRRRRRRRRGGGGGDADVSSDDPPNTIVKVREPRSSVDEVQGVSGSTRLEAKRQRRRDGREQRRTRPPILSESEFLARREAVERDMVVRQRDGRTQIAVLEDGVLVEHYVARTGTQTMAGNVYLGKVQNVLPSMEAAFVDIGRGRNAVLYAGEVNWDVAGLEGRTRTIEQALKPGGSVLVQVTKDPLGHKGARLTSHIALSGRHLVYVPGGNASGISRKLPDTERKRLRDLLKQIVPEGAGVIVRTAAEGASETDLRRDVARLQALWESIEAKAKTSSAPALLYEEPDLVIRVVRDLFNEDFRKLVVAGDEAFDLIEPYLTHVSPELVGRLQKHAATPDVFTDLRIDEQLLKALDRKVFLPSGGHLVIDRTEAMTVIDVNTGKFTGEGGNLEETVTRNNLEAAEEIVRQLRLRDLGGIVVIDFIDMVLESNRELVLRRLTECLGRDRTKHQVTEITSLGLVQMTRKRIGQGLLEAFSEPCEHCKGRGLIIHSEPLVDRSRPDGGGGRRGDRQADTGRVNGRRAEDGEGTGRRRGRRSSGTSDTGSDAASGKPAAVASAAGGDTGGGD